MLSRQCLSCKTYCYVYNQPWAKQLLLRNGRNWTSKPSHLLFLELGLTPCSDVSSDDSFPSLTLLAEVLAASVLPGSLDLISRLLDTLNAVLHYELPTQGDKSFVEQLLMSAIENAAGKVVVSHGLMYDVESY